MPKNDQYIYSKIAEDPDHISEELYESHSHVLDDTSKQALQKINILLFLIKPLFTNGGNGIYKGGAEVRRNGAVAIYKNITEKVKSYIRKSLKI